MTTPVPPSDTQGTPHPVDNFAETLQLFWLKNRNVILTCTAVILLGILARGGWAYYAEMHEKSIAADFTAAAVSSEKLKAFAAANEGHSLSGVAYLQLADEAFASSKFADAIAFYTKAGAALKGSILVGRAELGLAMSQLHSGKAVEAQAALRLIANDANQFKGYRAEACYHLLTLVSEAGKTEDAAKLCDQVMQIDATGLWAQRAMMIRATLPVSNEPAVKAEIAAPKLNVPGK